EMIGRLSPPLSLTIYYYRSEPTMLEPDEGGRHEPIEQVQAAHAHYRLLLLGTGEGLLDLVTLKPNAAAEKLTFWPQRPMLTPVPVGDWGGEEFMLGQCLQMPLGRATPNGLLGLTELLGLDGAEDRQLVDPRGDGLAQPLPAVFRLRPHRFLSDVPPSDLSVD